MRIVHSVVGVLLAINAVVVAGDAWAAGGGDKSDKGKTATSPSQGGAAELGVGDDVGLSATERSESRSHDNGKSPEQGEDTRPFVVGLDFVAGTASTSALNQIPAPVGSPGTGFSNAPTVSKAHVTATSFLPFVGYEFGHGIFGGLKIPFSLGQIDSGIDRTTAALGNIELDGAYLYEVNSMVALGFQLGVDLPTAQGMAVPANGADVPIVGGGVSSSDYDRGAIAKAVAATRGYEDNELYAVGHLGIVPKVKLLLHGETWHVDPYVKLDNLVATVTGYEHTYTGELVLGAEGGYKVCSAFEPAIKIWTNIPLTSEGYTAVAVVEPQLRFPLGDVTPLVGVLLPFAGPALTSPEAFGVRASIAARF